MGSRLLPTWRLAVAALLPAVLATGCSTTIFQWTGPGAEADGVGGRVKREHLLGSLAPEPLGTVTFRDHPVACILGWTGEIAGFAVGVYGGYAAGAVAIIVAGGLLTLFGRGIEEFWYLFFPGGDAYSDPNLEGSP